MTAHRDPDRLIHAFLMEGQTELPDQVYDAVRDRIEQTRQRTFIGPWRTSLVTKAMKYGLAAAAVVVIAIIGYQFLGNSNTGSPGASESAEPTPSPSATPAAAFPSAGAMAVGRHSMILAGVPLSIELTTTGWISNGDFGIDRGNYQTPTSGSAGFILWPASAPDNTYSVPCAKTALDPPAGPSAAELAAAVSNVPGLQLVSGPSAVTIGGHPAQHVVVNVPADIGCVPEKFYLWYDADDASGNLGRYASALNSTIQVWIIDVDGTIVWIDGETFATSGAAAAQEVEQIVNSIQFE